MRTSRSGGVHRHQLHLVQRRHGRAGSATALAASGQGVGPDPGHLLGREGRRHLVALAQTVAASCRSNRHRSPGRPPPSSRRRTTWPVRSQRIGGARRAGSSRRRPCGRRERNCARRVARPTHEREHAGGHRVERAGVADLRARRERAARRRPRRARSGLRACRRRGRRPGQARRAGQAVTVRLSADVAVAGRSIAATTSGMTCARTSAQRPVHRAAGGVLVAAAAELLARRRRRRCRPSSAG